MPGNNLTLYSATWDTTTEKFGTAALNGGYGTFPVSVVTTLPVTFDFWVKRAAAPSTFALPLGTGSTSTTNFWFGVEGSTGYPTLNPKNGVNISGTTSICDGAWHHVRLVLTSTASTLCIDGAQVATTPNSVVYDATPVGIGALGGAGGFPWGGEVDEFATFDVALPTTYTVPTAPYTGTEANLTGLWHLDSNGTDSSGAATIALSPTSVVGGTAGNVITVTGTGTTFSGTPFTLSGGLGALLTAQSVSSTTAGTVTISAGVQGYGSLTVDDATDSASATLTVTTPSLGALNIGWIGDSITAGTNGAPVTEAVSKLTAMGYTVTSTNRGISGTSTSDWAAGGADLTNAMAAFATAGTTIVHIMLGTNDVRTPNSFTAAQHAANMRGIVLALVGAGYKVIITKPLYSVPNSGSSGSQWPNDPNSLYLEYFTLDMQLVDGIRIFQGDTGGYEISSLNPTTFLAADGIHPANATENNILGDYWATAIVERFGNSLTPFIAQTINRYHNSDGDS